MIKTKESSMLFHGTRSESRASIVIILAIDDKRRNSSGPAPRTNWLRREELAVPQIVTHLLDHTSFSATKHRCRKGNGRLICISKENFTRILARTPFFSRVRVTRVLRSIISLVYSSILELFPPLLTLYLSLREFFFLLSWKILISGRGERESA